MMFLILGVILGFANLAGGDGSSAMKCGPLSGDPLVALDGRIVPGATRDDVAREDVWHVEMVCLDPSDSTFTRRQTGIGVVSIWTPDGPVPDMEPALAAVLAAQNRREEAGEPYLETLDSVDLSEIHEGVSLSVGTTADGWWATATVDRHLRTCAVYGGERPPDVSMLHPEAPGCFDTPAPGSAEGTPDARQSRSPPSLPASYSAIRSTTPSSIASSSTRS